MTEGSNSRISRQVKMPFRHAIRMSWSGVKNRIGRQVINALAVVLGIAFFCSTWTDRQLNQVLSSHTLARRLADSYRYRITAEVPKLKDKLVFLVVEDSKLLMDNEVKELQNQLTVQQARMETVLLTEGAKFTGTNKADAMVVWGAFPNASGRISELVAQTTPRVVVDTENRGDQRIQVPQGTILSVADRQAFGLKNEQASASERSKQVWITILSLMVSTIGISNAMLMSVTERFREIGTMKCLGALDIFIVKIFVLEALFVGALGAVLGGILGSVFSVMMRAFSLGFDLVANQVPYVGVLSGILVGVSIGIFLAVIATIYPAIIAARMPPAAALRSTI